MISKEGLKTLSFGIRQCKNLVHIDLGGNLITGNESEIFFKIL